MYLFHQIGCVSRISDDIIPRATKIHEASGTAGELSTLIAPVIKLIITMLELVGGGHTLYDGESVASEGKERGRGSKQLK